MEGTGLSRDVTPTMAGASFLYALSRAYHHARVDGQDSVGTDYVLYTIVRQCDPLRHSYGKAMERWRNAIKKANNSVLGKVHRKHSALYPQALDSVEFEAGGTLREAARLAYNRSPHQNISPAWRGETFNSVSRALQDARSVGVCHAHWGHLFLSVLADPRSRARKLLGELGIPRDRVRLPDHVDVRAAGKPRAPAADTLLYLGALSVPYNRFARMFSTAMGWAPAVRAGGGPVLVGLELEAIRQAVRGGAAQVSRAHLLLAICSVEQQLKTTGRSLRRDLAPYGEAATILAQWGIDYPTAATAVSRLPDNDIAIDSSRRWRSQRHDPGFGSVTAQTVTEAMALATHLGHRGRGASHVLSALLAHSHGAATTLLSSLGVNLPALASAVDAHLLQLRDSKNNRGAP